MSIMFSAVFYFSMLLLQKSDTCSFIMRLSVLASTVLNFPEESNETRWKYTCCCSFWSALLSGTPTWDLLQVVGLLPQNFWFGVLIDIVLVAFIAHFHPRSRCQQREVIWKVINPLLIQKKFVTSREMLWNLSYVKLPTPEVNRWTRTKTLLNHSRR